MKMIGVLSGFIDAVGWEDGVLEVWLKNGVGYRHKGVPKDQYEELFIHSEFGKVYNRIKNDFPACEKFLLPPRR